MPQTITVTDNRTGESYELPIENGGIAAKDFAKAVPGVWFYDPAFMQTAAAESAITYLDGDAGILRYRGYPIEQLAEKSTTCYCTANCPHKSRPMHGRRK